MSGSINDRSGKGVHVERLQGEHLDRPVHVLVLVDIVRRRLRRASRERLQQLGMSVIGEGQLNDPFLLVSDNSLLANWRQVGGCAKGKSLSGMDGGTRSLTPSRFLLWSYNGAPEAWRLKQRSQSCTSSESHCRRKRRQRLLRSKEPRSYCGYGSRRVGRRVREFC